MLAYEFIILWNKLGVLIFHCCLTNEHKLNLVQFLSWKMWVNWTEFYAEDLKRLKGRSFSLNLGWSWQALNVKWGDGAGWEGGGLRPTLPNYLVSHFCITESWSSWQSRVGTISAEVPVTFVMWSHHQGATNHLHSLNLWLSLHGQPEHTGVLHFTTHFIIHMFISGLCHKVNRLEI